MVAAGDRNPFVERPLYILGAPASTSISISLAISRGPSQCRTPGLACRAPGTSCRYRLHTDNNKSACLRAWFSFGNVGRRSRISGVVGHFPAFECTIAARPAPRAARLARTASLASFTGTRVRELRQSFAFDGFDLWHLQVPGTGTGCVRAGRDLPFNLYRTTGASI